MSANVDVVRSIYEEWERGNDRLAAWAHPEVEFVVVGLPDPSGRLDVADAVLAEKDFLSLWDDYRVEASEYRELGDGRVLVLGRVSGRGKSSGVKVSQGRASLFHVREGKVTRLVTYWDRDRAFADLGLAPEGT